MKVEFLKLTERLERLKAARDSVCDLIAYEENDDSIRDLLKRKKEISSEIDEVVREIEEYIQFAAGTG